MGIIRKYKRNSKRAIESRKNPEIRHGRHHVFLMHVHLVFVTKYRNFCFTERVLKDLEKIFKEISVDFNAELVEFSGEGDHVHLLINYPVTVSVSKLVNSLKGVSSRKIRAENYPEIKNKLWSNQLWTPSYFAGSCGGASLEVLKEYIENQERPNGN